MSSPALFLDRDGVINHEVGYLFRPSDVRWVDGIFPLCRRARAAGFRTVVVTNQSGIARGFYHEADFHSLMDWMRAAFAAEDTALDAVYYCPYHPEGQGAWAREHEDRKPGPGMLRRAARDLDLDLSASLLVGDRCSDMEAAAAAGVPHRFLIAGTEIRPCAVGHQTVAALAEVDVWLERHLDTTH